MVTVLNILKDWSCGKKYAILVARLIFIRGVSVNDACLWSEQEWYELENRGLIFRVPTCMVYEIIEAFLRERLSRVESSGNRMRSPSLQGAVFDADGNLV